MSFLGAMGIRRKGSEEAFEPDTEFADAATAGAQAVEREPISPLWRGPLFDRHENGNNPSRAQSTTIRILLALSGLSMAVNIIEGVALTELIPMHTVQPYLVTFSDKADQMVRVDPPTGHMMALGIILAQEIKSYVMARYTVTADQTETNDRWNTHVRLLSTQRVYQEFEEEMKVVRDLMAANKFTRQVIIVSTTNPEPGLYRVDFDTFDHITGTGLSDSTDKTSHYTATLKCGMSPKNVPRSDIALNPFGFAVFQYSVSPRRVAGETSK